MLFALGADGARGVNALIRGLGEEINVVLAQIGLNDLRQLSTEVINSHAEPICHAVEGPKPVHRSAQLKGTGS
jgi:L-lactate dehydrogenase (cytochrome)